MSCTLYRSLTAAVLLAFATQASAEMINEFEPNPAGADPATGIVELLGTPSATASGFLTFVDTDSGSALGGINNTAVAVAGTFDANGLLQVTIPFDAENPSYVLVYSSMTPVATDVDTDDDGNLDDPSVFGTAYDAIGVIDSTGDARNYAAQLGGQEFATDNEWELAFRDGVTLEWYGVDSFTGSAFDIDGNEIPEAFSLDDPSADITVPTFGEPNPSTIVPEPGSILLALLGAVSAMAIRMRRVLG